jgi:hypothetical protein
MSQWRDWDVVLLLVIGCIAMYVVPALIDGYCKFCAGRDLASRITAEHEARKALEKRAQ